jgi:GT2 family glycosyltransferase
VLVNYNGLDDTLACLGSLRRQTGVAVTPFVVDNGSTSPEGRVIAERFPEAIVIETGQNLGFAGGNNVALRRAIAEGFPFVMLLNNDTEITQSDALSRLVEVAQGATRAAVGAKIVYASEPSIVWYAGGLVDLDRGETEHVGVGALASTRSGVVATGFITGCALLASASVWKEVGELPEGYFLYFEDVDWSLRARSAGVELLVDLDAVIEHKISRSTRRTGPLDFYYLTRNRIELSKRWAGRRQHARVLARSLARAGWLVMHDLVHRDLRRARLTARGAWHGVRGVQGRIPKGRRERDS